MLLLDGSYSVVGYLKVYFVAKFSIKLFQGKNNWKIRNNDNYFYKLKTDF